MGKACEIPDIEYAGFLIRPPEDYVRHIMGRVGVAHHYGEKAKEFGVTMPDGYSAFQPEDAQYIVVMRQSKIVTELPSTVGTVYVDSQRRKVRIQSIYEG